MQNTTKIRLVIVLSIILTMTTGFGYTQTNAQPTSTQFMETYNLTIELINGQENQFASGETQYEIGGFQTNATDLQGISVGEGTDPSVDVDDDDVWFYATLKIPDPTNPRKSFVTDIASFLNVISVEEFEDGSKIYELERTYSTDDIGDHMIIDGVLTQNSEDEASLSLRLSP